ncbi:hypothetical protein QY97_03013 [Bacillus thermotolerans]|nr:hypothetical protein QY97_03013 [Bacillus thermotolerans]
MDKIKKESKFFLCKMWINKECSVDNVHMCDEKDRERVSNVDNYV